MKKTKVRKFVGEAEPVEAEIIETDGSVTPQAKLKAEVKERDELGQRNAVYKRYKNHVDYDKIGTDEYKEVIGTIIVQRNARGGLSAQPIFKSGAELAGAIDAYWDFLMKNANEGHTIVPDVEGLASFIGVARSTLMNWKRGEVNREFTPILEQTFNDIAAAKKQMGLHGKIPPIVMAMDFNNNHGYVNQQNTKIDVDVVSRREPLSADQLLAMAQMLPKNN